ncbi:S1C family serine protease [Fructobacillus parabroussonetiae]|uniref:Trypsin-like serine protease n=1 Tax=Fructobacillus parabroussonetiae TaxID=2713174 RepID=A0ABS5QUZ2_9LACO|nr:trypsin-like peptidase domain-containing protein [Fructobacillus parabroussonetiae]MBS9337018.1 trypsin-like serine protease [Fructobacillus parabroussonetiae]
MRRHIVFIKSKFWPTIALVIALFVGAGVVFASTLPNSWYQARLAKATHTNASGTATVAAVAYTSNDKAKTAFTKVKNAVVTVQNLQKSASLEDGAGAFDSQNKNTDSNNYQTASQGSGVVLKINKGSADIITNYHVIENSAAIQVVDANGDKATATILKSDASQDLALIRVKSTAFKKVATLADSDKVVTGQNVMAIGSPLGADYSSTMTKGIVSQAKRSLTANETNNKAVTVIQTDAAINQGNSGGALINDAGQVIGIASSKITASAQNTNVEGMGFAIPSNQVADFIKS